MHTTVEMVHQKDVEQLITWLYGFVTSLQAGDPFDVAMDV